jgi:DNA-binding CsgD family transcriptional regulator/PAS domain-containing protein
MGRAEAILKAVHALYDGLFSPDGPKSALPAVAEAANADMITFHHSAGPDGEPALFASVGCDPERLATLRSMAVVRGALPAWTRRLPAGRPISRAEHISDRDFVRGEFYNEAVRPTRCFHAVMTRLEREFQPDAFLVCSRRLSSENFGEEEAAAARALAPHLASAVKLELRLRAADRRALDATAALDALSAGVVVVDAALRPVPVNARARALAEARDGLQIGKAGLTASSAAETPALEKALAAATALASQPAHADYVEPALCSLRLCLSRRGGERRLIAAIAPLRPTDSRAALKGLLGAAIFLLEPDRSAPIDAELLVESFGLAPREAELVVLLAGGADLRCAAGQMGISVGTARWYLKQAQGKTGAHRQSDLVRLAAGFAVRLQ